MTDDEKLKIRLAEAMGLELTHQWVIWEDGNPFKFPYEVFDSKEKATSFLSQYLQDGHISSGRIEHRTGYKDFNPHESWDDCMEAVEKTCKSDTVPFQYALTIVKLNDGTYRATIETYTHPSGYKAHVGKAETRKAAVCAALLEYGEKK